MLTHNPPNAIGNTTVGNRERIASDAISQERGIRRYLSIFGKIQEIVYAEICKRHWINYQIPRYLMSLGDIANVIFRKNNLTLYVINSYFAY